MAKITKKDFDREVIQQNESQALSGSNIYFESNPRNGMQALDYGVIDELGKKEYKGNIDVGTSRECLARLHTEKSYYHAKVYFRSTLTRKTAKGVLSGYIDFNLDPHQLSFRQKDLLHTWAKLTNYKKPLNHSRGHGFFIHLQKRVSI